MNGRMLSHMSPSRQPAKSDRCDRALRHSASGDAGRGAPIAPAAARKLPAMASFSCGDAAMGVAGGRTRSRPIRFSWGRCRCDWCLRNGLKARSDDAPDICSCSRLRVTPAGGPPLRQQPPANFRQWLRFHAAMPQWGWRAAGPEAALFGVRCGVRPPRASTCPAPDPASLSPCCTSTAARRS